jgi:hypothetical protein
LSLFLRRLARAENTLRPESVVANQSLQSSVDCIAFFLLAHSRLAARLAPGRYGRQSAFGFHRKTQTDLARNEKGRFVPNSSQMAAANRRASASGTTSNDDRVYLRTGIWAVLRHQGMTLVTRNVFIRPRSKFVGEVLLSFGEIELMDQVISVSTALLEFAD